MKNFKKICTDYFFVILGSFIVAFSINLFLVPQKLSTGGISGVGTILLYLFKVPLSVTTLFFNAMLYVFGYKILNRNSLIKTTVGIVFLSFFLEITKNFHPFADDIIISSVFGGGLAGVGVGFVVLKEASTGGSDFLALMLHKKLRHFSLARIIFIIDFCVIIATGIVFKDYTILFYSLISLYISTRVADYILVRGDYAKSLYIISGKNDIIATLILKDMNRGVTGIYAKGYYSNTDTTMLMCIVRAKEVPHIISLIKSVDDMSFIIVSEVREVRGQGFKEI